MKSNKNILEELSNNEESVKNSNKDKIFFTFFTILLSTIFILGLFNNIAKWVILTSCLFFFIFQLLNKKGNENSFKNGTPLYKIRFIIIFLTCIGSLFNENVARVFILYITISILAEGITSHFKKNKLFNDVLGIIIFLLAITMVYFLYF